MRSVSAAWPATIATSHAIVTEVTSWRNGVQLGGTIPISGGSLTFNQSADARRHCTIDVPRIGNDGFNWMPNEGNALTHPLARNGQRLRVRTGVRHANGTVELLNLGWYLITSVGGRGGTVSVQAEDLWRLLDDCIVPSGAAKGWGTGAAYDLAEVVSDLTWTLLRAGSGISIIPEAWSTVTKLTSIPIPSPENTSRTDLLKRVMELARTRYDIDDDGVLDIKARITVPTTLPVLTLTDGEGGAILDRAPDMRRDGLLNQVTVVATSPSTGKEVARASRTIASGGPLDRTIFGPVSRFEITQDLTTATQCGDRAQEILDAESAAIQVEQVDIVPNPAIQLLDTVLISGGADPDFKGLVTAIRCPLTSQSAAMTLTVASGL